MTRILVADDEMTIANSIAYALRREHFEVDTAYDGMETMEKIRLYKPNILILDVMMPGKDGYEICRELSSREDIWIILLTAKSDLIDKVIGLELGADDYMTKPFEMIELIARVKVISRRLDGQKNFKTNEHPVLKIKDMEIRSEERLVRIQEKEVFFKPKEFDLLYLLFSNLNRVFSRDEILNRIWEYDYDGNTRTVDIHIRRIRQKLGSIREKHIKTIPRIGYKAVGDIDED
jgi:DNA-binding response OmpR family regulator